MSFQASARSDAAGTTPRPGGGTRITNQGHPVYYFIHDKDDGRSNGQGAHAFGAYWYVVAPSADKVDNS